MAVQADHSSDPSHRPDPGDGHAEQVLLVRIDGMHCHRCEDAIRLAISRHPGVHEVEVDFPSHQASILFNPALSTPALLLASIQSAGYTVASSNLLNPSDRPR